MEVDPVVYAKDQQRQDGLVITAAVFTSISCKYRFACPDRSG